MSRAVYLLHDGYDGPVSVHASKQGAKDEKERLIKEDVARQAEQWYRSFNNGMYASLAECVTHQQSSARESFFVEEMELRA